MISPEVSSLLSIVSPLAAVATILLARRKDARVEAAAEAEMRIIVQNVEKSIIRTESDLKMSIKELKDDLREMNARSRENEQNSIRLQQQVSALKDEQDALKLEVAALKNREARA